MRVLVVGGLGFLGSHIVEKLNRENDEIGILDDLSTGKKRNVHCKTQLFRLRADDRRCLEVMRNFKADCVVHCAWRSSGAVPDPFDATGLNGLDNLLQGAVASGVRRFLLVEEYQVDKEQAHAQRMADLLCAEYQGKGGLQIGIFRMTHLYGPRMTENRAGGPLLSWLHAIEREPTGNELVIKGLRPFSRESPDEPRDWLYVSDAAEAVFRFSEGAGSGSYDLSSGQAYDRAQIRAQIRAVRSWLQQGDTWPDAETSDPTHSLIAPPKSSAGVDNAAIKHDLDWIPLRNLSEGLLPTLRWSAAIQRKQKDGSPLPGELDESDRTWPNRWIPGWKQAKTPPLSEVRLKGILTSLPIIRLFRFFMGIKIVSKLL